MSNSYSAFTLSSHITFLIKAKESPTKPTLANWSQRACAREGNTHLVEMPILVTIFLSIVSESSAVPNSTVVHMASPMCSFCPSFVPGPGSSIAQFSWHHVACVLGCRLGLYHICLIAILSQRSVDDIQRAGWRTTQDHLCANSWEITSSEHSLLLWPTVSKYETDWWAFAVQALKCAFPGGHWMLSFKPGWATPPS